MDGDPNVNFIPGLDGQNLWARMQSPLVRIGSHHDGQPSADKSLQCMGHILSLLSSNTRPARFPFVRPAFANSIPKGTRCSEEQKSGASQKIKGCCPMADRHKHRDCGLAERPSRLELRLIKCRYSISCRACHLGAEAQSPTTSRIKFLLFEPTMVEPWRLGGGGVGIMAAA